MTTPDETVNVRYMVDDVQTAVDFYTKHLGFGPGTTNAAPAFADIRRGNLRLLLSGPTSSAGRPMPDGATPGPGGWNRIHLIVDDIGAEVDRLRADGVPVRNEVITGPGGSQVLVEDPSQRTMAGALGAFQGHYATDIPLLCAGTILILLPTLILFILFQRQVIAALLQGSVKG